MPQARQTSPLRRVRHLLGSVLTLVLLGMGLVALPGTASAAPATHTVTFDGYSWMIDGKRTYLWAGEFHYFRLPSPDLWRDVLEKMKAGGFNTVSLYFDWAYHSPKPGVYDFSGVRDVDKLLDMAEEVGLYVIARPGPYINAEVDSGGFPGWLTTQQGRARSTAADYLAASDEWLSQIDPIIARHQLTNGTGTVISYQVENEFYDRTAVADQYMEHLKQKARADGITVPLVGNHNNNFTTGLGALDVDSPDSYPQGFNCSNPASWRPVQEYETRYRYPDHPLRIAEFQGGAFDPWGGPGYDRCRQLTGPEFQKVFYKHNIAQGVTEQSFYMAYGGTSWGWQADPQQVYTSYDYGAAITEARQLGAKYDEDKRIGYFTQSVAPLTKTDRMTAAPPTNPAILDTARVNPDTGTQFHTLRHLDSVSTATNSTHLALDLGTAGAYPTVPQQPGTQITLAGRDSKILVANYRLGAQQLQYSTSEILTSEQIADRDVAVLYGRSGQAGETVLRYAARPTVQVLSGDVATTWDAASGDLRLNYAHTGLARVLVTGGERPLLLLLGTDEVAATFWREQTDSGPVLVRGPYLLRNATSTGTALELTGDTSTAGEFEVFSAASTISWNGRRIRTVPTTSGSQLGTLAGPVPFSLPTLTNWKRASGSPESAPDFDDSGWQVADRMTSNSITTPLSRPVLFADDYGFHYGDIWYRGRFRGDTAQTGVNLSAITGRAGVWSVWLNGQFLGSSSPSGSTTGSQQIFQFPAGAVRVGADNVLSVLVENMGHNEDYRYNDTHKEARGLIGASLTGSLFDAITWRIQGARGGQDLIDPVRGPMNNGGLYGERAGWSLPGFPDDEWATVALPHADQTPGVSWYRTEVELDLPRRQDTSVGIRIDDDPARRYRAQIFVNGWQLGRYINNVGPQHSFPIPNGILRPNGTNTIAIAVWNTDATSGGLGTVTLESYGSHASPLQVANVDSPRYNRARYAMPDAPRTAISLTAPDNIRSGESIEVSAEFRVTEGAAATAVLGSLAVPAGWSVAPTTSLRADRVRVGETATFGWRVTAPAGDLASASLLTASASYVQGRQAGRAVDVRVVNNPPAAPTADTAVSALPFLFSTNGWGPVERNMSNGESVAGDGRPITVAGTVYASGLGTNSPSDVSVYLGGNCTRLTAVLGIDDEIATGGSVTFSVLADGRTLYTSPILTAVSEALPLDVDITGAQVVSLVVGNGGDTNGLDHGDWADARVACSGGAAPTAPVA
ncbi:MAG TPA: beta-galactosidase [Micromonosporaceae bacterium]|nr:beta-galactosidase [Micromonosporaceae bacterium]